MTQFNDSKNPLSIIEKKCYNKNIEGDEMKEFLNALKCTIIFQLLCWGCFVICDENKFIPQSSAEDLALSSGLLILVILLFVYFLFANKYIKSNNMNSKRFNIILFFLWTISSILIMFESMNLVSNNYLHVCQDTGWDCFLNGIEYGIEGFFMVVLAILILIIKVIIMIYKHIKKKKQ